MQNEDLLGQRDRLGGMIKGFVYNDKSVLRASGNGKVKLTEARGKDAPLTV